MCNRTRRTSTPSLLDAHLCLSSPQLVDNLATASKVVELVDARTHRLLRDCFLCYGICVYCERCSVLVRPRRSVERRVWPPRGGVIGVIWPCSWPHGGLCVDAISIKGMSFSSVFIDVTNDSRSLLLELMSALGESISANAEKNHSSTSDRCICVRHMLQVRQNNN